MGKTKKNSQLNRESLKILKEYSLKRDTIYKEANNNNTWSDDSNKNELLFKDLEKEYKRKLDDLDDFHYECNNSNLLWRWALVGNVVDENVYGEESEIRHGTKHFSPGAKVYMAPPNWGDGYEKIRVIGMSRPHHRYEHIIMESRLIDFDTLRIQKVYNPTILNMMNQSEKQEDYCSWWNNSDEDFSSILTWLSKEEANKAIEKYKIDVKLKERDGINTSYKQRADNPKDNEKTRDVDIIHIVFNDGDGGDLIRWLKKDAKIFNFPAYLQFGDISKVESYKTRKSDYLLLERQMFFKQESNPSNHGQFLKFYKMVDRNKWMQRTFLLYADKKCSEDYCDLLYVCELLKNERLCVIDFPEDKNPDIHIYDILCEDESHELTYSLITSEDKERYINEWNSLKKTNAELRVIENGKIVSHKYSDYYDYIKSYYPKDKEIDFMKVIGEILGENGPLDYHQLIIVTNKMIDDGELEIVRVEPDKWYEFAKKVFVKIKEK